jgi:hypothetical protein
MRAGNRLDDLRRFYAIAIGDSRVLRRVMFGKEKGATP